MPYDDIDFGAILEELNNKLDLNALNMNAQGKKFISGLGMPSDVYEDLTLLPSGSTYTAPANGWFILAKVSNSAGRFINMYGSSLMSYSNNPGPNNLLSAFLPVPKNDTIQIDYNADGVNVRFKFVYAEGEI